jgi:arylsulfatase A-like enzyme
VSRAAVLATAAFALLAAAGCGGSEGTAPAGDAFPRGLAAAGTGIVCAPSRDWQPEAGGGWSFRGVAEVACGVLRPPGGEVVLTFDPAGDSRGFRFDLEWDGRPLPEGIRSDGPMRIALPAAWLDEGSHVLRLTRRVEPDDEGRAVNRFRSVGIVLPAEAGPRESLFVARAAERYHYVGDLLITGVTGVGGTKLSGPLFAGPGRLELDLPAGAGSLHVRPENLSAAPPRFTVEIAGGRPAAAEVAPRQRGAITVPLPARRGGAAVRAVLRVEGEPGGLFLWGAPRLGAGADEEAPPPVVLVTLDTTRRDVLGAYGGPGGLTPHLDAFAAGATVYERATSTAPWTLPAHASMFTGLYPGRHRAGVTDHRLPAAVPSLPDELRRLGYRTAGFAGGRLVAHDFGIARGFDVYADPEGFETRGDRLTAAIVEELEQRLSGPLFLFANYFDPHWRYDAPPAFQRRTGVPAARRALAAPGEPVAWPRVATGDQEAWRRAVDGELPLTAAARRWLDAAYRAEVAFMDEELGVLFAALRRQGLWDRAWVVVVADHGELLGEEGYLSHAYRLDPELIAVPLLVKRPWQTEGRREAALTSVADLFPTLLAAAGGTVPDGLDGRPLGRPGDRGRVYSEEHQSRIHLLPNPHLRLAHHVYGAESASERRVLWDGGQHCARRLADGEEGRGGWRRTECGGGDPAAALAALERRLGRRQGSTPGRLSPDDLSDEDRKALTALGYL